MAKPGMNSAMSLRNELQSRVLDGASFAFDNFQVLPACGEENRHTSG